jgi:hypothetical protein
MKAFFEKNIRKISLSALLVIPFLLYFSALNHCYWGVYFLLGLMGVSMLLAIKAG